MNNSQNILSKADGEIVTTPVEYLDRAFREDADHAMKNDIVLGLIEAITNADDAYGDSEGSILIRVDTSASDQTIVTVSDRACGISPTEMVPRLTRLGAQTSGHEAGKAVRGNRGRGGKDLASFGKVRWESVYDGKYSWLEITRDGKARYMSNISKGERATPELRDRLGIKHGNGTGTVVTISWTHAPRRPQNAVLKSHLEQCVPLHDIMQSDKRHMKLQYNDGRVQKLSYARPAGLKLVERVPVPVPPYPGQAVVEIWESPEPLKGSPGDLYRQNGLRIKRGGTVHEATLFGLEGDSFAQFFTGEVRWDTIDNLIRDFDDQEKRGEKVSENNPFSIISRTRDSLERTHLAYKALQAAVEKILRKHVDRRRDEEARDTRENADTRRRLDQLARIVAKFRAEKDEEFELESSGEGVTGWPQPTASLQIIPSGKILEQGKSHTFTVQLRKDMLVTEDSLPVARLTVVAEPEDVVTLSTTEVQFEKSPKRPDVLRGTFTVRAGDVNGQAAVEASLDNVGSAMTEIDIVDPIVAEPPSPPITFMFEHSHYKVALGKQKKLLLLAPNAVVEKHGNRITITNSNGQGVLIRTHPLQLEHSKDGDWYEATVIIEGHQLNATAIITAQCALLKAPAEIKVGQEQAGPAIEIRISRLPGYYRGSLKRDEETGNIEIIVNGEDPAAKRYMGPELAGFPGQGSREARLIIAEVVADEVIRDILTRRYSTTAMNVTTYFVQRAQLLNQLLPQCHANQLPDAELSTDLVNYAT